MEIAIAKMGELRILSVKGNLRLQHWRVIDKHLETLLGHGAIWVAVDLSGAALDRDSALDSLARNARMFRERRARLLIQSDSAALREALRSLPSGIDPAECVFADRDSLMASLRGLEPFPASGKLD